MSDSGVPAAWHVVYLIGVLYTAKMFVSHGTIVSADVGYLEKDPVCN